MWGGRGGARWGGGPGLGPPPTCLLLSPGSSNLYQPLNPEKEVFPAPPAGTSLPATLDEDSGGLGGTWSRLGLSCPCP